MRSLFKFNKNASVLTVLLCCLFFNPGEGMAQTGKWEIPIGNNKKIIVTPEDKISGACSDPVGYSATYNGLFTTGQDVKKLTDSAFLKTPPSKYFKVKAWDFFSFRVLLPEGVTNNPNGPLNGPPNGALDWTFHTDAAFEYLGNVTVDNVVYKDYRAKGRIVGGNKRGWWLASLEINTPPSPATTYRCLVIPIISEGQLNLDEVPVLGSTIQPRIPYMILHAPPGDGSSSEFQETKTTCRELVETNSTDNSNSANLDVKLGIAGSVGFIATVDFEFSVTFSAGISAGDMAIKTTSNQTCVTASQGFSTNALQGLDGSGDVFIGYGTDLNYGVYQGIKINPNTCTAFQDTALIYAPTGNPRKFAWTEEQIQEDIVTQQAIADNPAYAVRARNEAQNQVDVWKQVLALNNANKNNPNNQLLESFSFSSGANSNEETSITVLETNSLEVEHYVDFTTGISSVVEIGGSGVSGGYEYKGSYRYGKTNNSSTEAAKVVRYTLSDDDGGDLFNLKVLRDPMFGTPVFRLEPSSKTSCPYQGAYQRDQPKLKHDGTTSDHITSSGNPLGGTATFLIDICNESNEPRNYYLALNANSNPNNAEVRVAGALLNGNDNGQLFTIPANSCLQNYEVAVKQATQLSYPNLELFLYPECEGSQVGSKQIQSSIFASVYFGNATGVNDLADNNLLSVSPNPTSGLLKISLPEGNTLEAVRVMDLAGRTVQYIEPGAAASNTEINLGALPKGMYALQVRSEGAVFVKKVSVQ